MTWLRDVLVLKSCANESLCDPAFLRYAWRQDEMSIWGDAFEIFEISGFLADLQQIHVAQARNVNRPLSLETFLLRLRNRPIAKSS